MRERENDDVGAEEDINLTPMLDVVFIMLIFFIVTATFVREPGVHVIKPEAQKAVDIKGVAVLIAVDANNVVHIAKKKVPVDGVRAEVEQLRSENPNGPVVIQADKQADTGVVVRVMNEVNATGAPVSVSTKKE